MFSDNKNLKKHTESGILVTIHKTECPNTSGIIFAPYILPEFVETIKNLEMSDVSVSLYHNDNVKMYPLTVTGTEHDNKKTES